MAALASHEIDITSGIRGEEKPAAWYDDFFAESQVYNAHYSQTCYYFLWSVIADRIIENGHERVLEIGCGPGQLATLLHDRGIRTYRGVDFSKTAIELAREKVPDFQFDVTDVRDQSIYATDEFDIVVCTEVLEHIILDIQVVSIFPEGKRCILTVPNFPSPSHVRFFRNEVEVGERYRTFFSSWRITTLQGTRSVDERFFIFDGIRNESTLSTFYL